MNNSLCTFLERVSPM